MVYTADLKSAVRKGMRVRVPPSAPDSGVSIMDNTEGFYPFNVGSIPARRTNLRS